MAKVKEKEVDLGRLCASMRDDRQALRYARESRREITRRLAGMHWSEEGTSYTNPVNLLDLYTSIVSRMLVPNNPRWLLQTWDRQNKAAVSAMQSWGNKEIVRMGFKETLERIVVDALISVGIAKVALADPGDSARMAWRLSAGQPFVEQVDLDDFVRDVHSRDFAQDGYIGHRFRIPLDVAKDSKIFSKERLSLEPDVDEAYNAEGDERISMLGRTYYSTNNEEWEDMVTLWEVYVPRHRLVFTMHDTQLEGPNAEKGSKLYGKALRVQRWLGPDRGPYHILGYKTIPGNAMPKGPLQDLVDLHDPVNNIYRKLISQAQRQKQLLGCVGGADADVQRIVDAMDGEAIRMDSPEKSVVRDFGGPNQQNFLMGGHLKDMFDFMAGGLALIGGLAPQSKTLGQDKMLNASASGQVSAMQDRTVGFTAGCLRALGWYWWNHPQLVMRTHEALPGIPDMGIQRTVLPSQRMRGRFDDLELEVDPYSMQYSSPSDRLQAMNSVVQGILVPMMQVLQQQGIAFDMQAYLSKVGVLMNMPDLSDIVTIQEPPQHDAQGGGGGPAGAGGAPAPGTPPQTTRNYVRHSAGSDTPQNRDATLMNSLNAHQPSQNGNGAM